MTALVSVATCHKLMDYLSCWRQQSTAIWINKNLLLSKLHSPLSASVSKRGTYARSGDDIWFTLCIIIWRSMSVSQRHPVNHSWTEESFYQAQRHDNSGVTVQPVSKYSICHSGPKAQFSWLSSPWFFVSTSFLSWLRVVEVLFLWLHKHVHLQSITSAVLRVL